MSTELTPEIIARVDAWIEKRSTPAWKARWRHMTSARGLALLSGRTEEAETAEAAMVGVLLGLARLAWGDPYASAVYRHGLPRRQWHFNHAAARTTGPDIESPPDINGDTEAETLHAALEAAP